METDAKNNLFVPANAQENDVDYIKNVLSFPQLEIISSFWTDKYSTEQGRNWDKFYNRNGTKFFQNRSYICDRLLELISQYAGVKADYFEKVHVFFDLGCGVGNALFNILTFPKFNFEIYAFDVSKNAIKLLLNEYYNLLNVKNIKSSLKGIGIWDLINELQPSSFAAPKKDKDFCDCINTITDLHLPKFEIAALIFVLSAIPPENFDDVLKNIAFHAGNGAFLYFRDYAANDAKECRFSLLGRSKLGDHYYVRNDKTLSYFFETDFLKELMAKHGFAEVYHNVISLSSSRSYNDKDKIKEHLHNEKAQNEITTRIKISKEIRARKWHEALYVFQTNF